jgi:hypothetical protein
VPGVLHGFVCLNRGQVEMPLPRFGSVDADAMTQLSKVSLSTTEDKKTAIIAE